MFINNPKTRKIMKKIYQKPFIYVENIELNKAILLIVSPTSADSGKTQESRDRGSRNDDNFEDLW